MKFKMKTSTNTENVSLTPSFVQIVDFLFEVRAYDIIMTSHLLKRNGESRSTGSKG